MNGFERGGSSPFLTIRQTAATGLISEHHLRLRLKQGRLPGFYSGRWFWIDYAALVDLLHQESRANVVADSKRLGNASVSAQERS